MPPRLLILVEAKDAASGVLKDVGGQAKGLGGILGDVGKIAVGFVLGAGLLQLPGFLMDAAKGAAEDAQGMAKLKQAVENTGASFGDYAGQLNDTINAG